MINKEKLKLRDLTESFDLDQMDNILESPQKEESKIFSYKLECSRTYSSTYVMNESQRAPNEVRNNSQPSGPVIKELSNINHVWKFYVKFDPKFQLENFSDGILKRTWFLSIVYLDKDAINIFGLLGNKDTCNNIRFVLSTGYIFENINYNDVGDMGRMCCTSICKFSKKNIVSHKIKIYSDKFINKICENLIYFGTRNISELRNFIKTVNDGFRFSSHFSNDLINSKLQNNLNLNNNMIIFQNHDFTEMTITSTGKLESSVTSIRLCMSYYRTIGANSFSDQISSANIRMEEKKMSESQRKQLKLQTNFLSTLCIMSTHELCKDIANEASSLSKLFKIQMPMSDSEICLIKLETEYYKTFPLKVRGIIEINDNNIINLCIDVHVFHIFNFLPIGKATLRISLPDSWSTVFMIAKGKKENYVNIPSKNHGFENDRCKLYISNGNVSYERACSSLIWNLDWLSNISQNSKHSNLPIENLTCRISLPFDLKKPENFKPYVEVETQIIKVQNPIIEFSSINFFDRSQNNLNEESTPDLFIYNTRGFIFKFYIAVKEDNVTREISSDVND